MIEQYAFLVIAILIVGFIVVVRYFDRKVQTSNLQVLAKEKKIVTRTECPNCGRLGEFKQKGMGFGAFFLASIVLIIIDVAVFVIPIINIIVILASIIGWFYMLMNVRKKVGCSECGFEGTPNRIKGYYTMENGKTKFVKEFESKE